jgi:hypothetical protein
MMILQGLKHAGVFNFSCFKLGETNCTFGWFLSYFCYLYTMNRIKLLDSSVTANIKSTHQIQSIFFCMGIIAGIKIISALPFQV